MHETGISYTCDDQSATIKLSPDAVEALYTVLDVIWASPHTTGAKSKIGRAGWNVIQDLAHVLDAVKPRICPTRCASCAKTTPVGHPGCLCETRHEVMRAATAMQELFDDPEAPMQDWFSAKYAAAQSRVAQARAAYGKQVCAIKNWEETNG